MRNRPWIKLDNASKIFLATYNKTDTKVFRLSAELTEPIQPELLQEALDVTYDQFKLYQYVIRKGIFWYYLEHSQLKPKVEPVSQAPCLAIYQAGKKNLLFRVTYTGQLIHLEVFHSLSDGTGAMWFLEALLFQYLKRRYPDTFSAKDIYSSPGSLKQQMDDSFSRYFGYVGNKRFDRHLRLDFAELKEALQVKSHRSKIYHVKGIRTMDRRMRFVHATMPAKSVLTLAKAKQTTMTVYLTAAYILAVYRDAPIAKQGRTISVTVPINLRQYFQSASARNFFATMQVAHSFQPGDEQKSDDELMTAICRDLETQFSLALTKESLERKVHALRAYENNWLVRLIPLFIKDGVLRLINAFNNRNLTLGISNLGVIRFGEEVDAFVKGLSVEISAIRPQFCAVTHGNCLTICFTSPFIETEIQKNMIRFLSYQGIEVTVAANRVGNYEERV